MNGVSAVEAMCALLNHLKDKLGPDWEESLPMGIPGHSTTGLKNLHKGILDVVMKDDAIPVGQDKLFRARELPDFKKMSDQVEDELARRGESFQKVPW